MAPAANPPALPATEAGGPNATIVLTDADHEVALRTILDGMWSTSGAACMSTARILVHESIHDEILDRVVAASEQLIVGDGLDPETDIGPVPDARQKERILSQIEIATQEGARVVMQGITPTDPRLAAGYWVPPTVLADVKPDMRIAQEEICGPVACFLKFSTEDDAIEIANDADFGFSAAVCTVDLVPGIASRQTTGVRTRAHQQLRPRGNGGRPVRRRQRQRPRSRACRWDALELRSFEEHPHTEKTARSRWPCAECVLS